MITFIYTRATDVDFLKVIHYDVFSPNAQTWTVSETEK